MYFKIKYKKILPTQKLRGTNIQKKNEKTKLFLRRFSIEYLLMKQF